LNHTFVLDRANSVLYVKRKGASIARSRESDHDGELVLNLDVNGTVVGVQLLSVGGLPWSVWLNHPDRSKLPNELREDMDAYLAEILQH